jgi:hypothetical protein
MRFSLCTVLVRFEWLAYELLRAHKRKYKTMKKIIMLVGLAISLVSNATLSAHDAQGVSNGGTVTTVPYKKSVHRLNPLLPMETAAVPVGWRDTVRTGGRWTVSCVPGTNGVPVKTVTAGEVYFDKERASTLTTLATVVGVARDGAVAFAAPYAAVKLPGALRDSRDTTVVCPPNHNNLPVAPVGPPLKP